jgi:dephospho-CoA kinase
MKSLEINYIGIAGLIASGKSTVAEYFSKVHGYSRLSFGRMIYQRLEKTGVVIDRDSLQKEGEAVIKLLGYQGIAELLLDTKDENPHQTIEGIRHADVASFYRKNFGVRFKMIFVDCPYELRFQRALGRDPELTQAIFDEQASAPIEMPASELKESADYVVINTGDIGSLHAQLSGQ